MKLISTRSTIQRQEVTALAILETGGATLASIWYYFEFGSFVHFAIAATLAPILLIRTPASTQYGISLAFASLPLIRRFISMMGVKESSTSETRAALDLFIFFIANIFTIIVFFVVKVVAGIAGLVTRPIESLTYIPENWRKIVLCTDTATLPEIIPGISELTEDDPRAQLIRWRLEYWFPRSPEHRSSILAWIVTTLVALPILIAAVAYRWSIKMTAIIWSPLVWAFRPFERNDNIVRFARGIVDLSMSRFGRIYSGFVILFCAVKCLIFVFWLRLDQALVALLRTPGIESYLAPASIPLWHVTAFLSACITWVVFFRSERFLLLSGSAVHASSNSFRLFIQGAFVLWNFFSIYSAVCMLYITNRLVGSIEIPALSFVVFPW